ncbi:MAG TPA: hypothetical protein VEY89_05055, partial [Candidatus Dormibacteraeota bacterium]|nr:hypothetical protein [Candidatus Dormibacteraeota bacterium]
MAMNNRLADFWWGRVPARAGRLSSALGTVFTDGAYLEVSPVVAALAPLLALVVGFLVGWRHPLATDLFTTSVAVMVLALLVGTLSAAVGAWLVIGYAVGDVVLGVRDTVFLGTFTNSGKTWAALILCDLVFALLVVLIPLTARALAGEVGMRWFARSGPAPVVALTAVASALLVFAWTQAALVLTRPYFTWHALPPNQASIDALHTAAWALPLVAAGAALLRAYLELRYGSRIPPRAPLPARPRHAHRVQPLGLLLRVLLAVFILAGLMDTWVDAVIIGVAMAVLLSLREPALQRFGERTAVMMRVPVLPRLIAGSVISAIIAIVLVAALGASSVVRPVVISTIVSLVVFTVLLPDHILAGREPHEVADLGTSSTPVPPPVAEAPAATSGSAHAAVCSA